MESYQSKLLNWRQTQEDQLRSDHGWLTLVGLAWLNEGANTVGSAPENDIPLPDSAPTSLGVLELENGQVSLTVKTGEQVIVNDQVCTGVVLLRNDHADEGPSLVKIGSVTFYIIKRADQYGVRIRDANNPARVEFTGRRWFPVDPAYKVQAVYTPHPTSRTLQVINSVGLVVPMENPGVVEFTLHGQTVKLEAFEAGESQLWFIFKDATNRSSTYGAGRFLEASFEADGALWIDFNYAYSPPCAFTDYATCPLPPRENVLTIPIEAGERL